MKDSIKLVVTDLDGTLFNDSTEISETNLKAIQGIVNMKIGFGIASGRSVDIIKNIAIRYGFMEYLELIIGYNGVVLYTKDSINDIKPQFLRGDIIRSLVERFIDYDISFVIHEEGKLIASKETPYVYLEKDLNEYDMEIKPDFIGYIKKDYPKLMLVGSGSILDQLDSEVSKLNQMGFHSFRSHLNFLEVVMKGVSKGETLAKYCDYKGIKPSEVMTFGDNLNDLEMIEFADYGFAMNNSVERLKNSARFIAKSNQDDGFAYGVHEILDL